MPEGAGEAPRAPARDRRRHRAGRGAPAFDFHASLLSLPHILGTTLETIPREVPYIPAPEDPPAAAGALAGGGGLRVGLVWAGNPSHPNDRNRSIPLREFEAVLETEGVRFFGLQVGEQREEIAGSGLEGRIEDLGGSLADFAATASVIARLDLLISVDTAPAHLAGAMGKAVWTLLPFAPDWRWMLDREDSPWYPTMRLFRQKRIGDWEGTLREVKKNLERMARPAPPSC